MIILLSILSMLSPSTVFAEESYTVTFPTPIAADESNTEGIMPMSDVIVWRYQMIGNKMYRRRYNETKKMDWQLGISVVIWYLQTFCTEKQDWRVFKLNRILELEVLEEGFSQLNPPGPIETFEGEYPKVTLRFPKEMSYRVYDEFDKTQIQRQENGDLIVSANMPEDSWLIGFLLSFGTRVDILSPAHLKESVAEQAKLIYEKNRT